MVGRGLIDAAARTYSRVMIASCSPHLARGLWALALALCLGACARYAPFSFGGMGSWTEARATASRNAAAMPRELREFVAPDGMSIIPIARRLPGEWARHVVRRGETLSEIAQSYNVGTDELVSTNRLRSPDSVFAGRVITIPAQHPVPRPAAIEIATAGEHIVARGNSLALIAKAHGVRLTDLIAANPELDPSRILPGQRVRIPAVESVAPAVVATVERMTPKEVEASRGVAAARPPSLTGNGFVWPVRGNVISAFGEKADGSRNDGINISAELGTPVVAAENGIVVYAGDAIPGFGQMLLIRHAGGFTTAYAHNDDLQVAVGDRVTRGQTIASVGRTGNVKRPQLHFELRAGKRPVDPLPQLDRDGPELASSR